MIEFILHLRYIRGFGYSAILHKSTPAPGTQRKRNPFNIKGLRFFVGYFVPVFVPRLKINPFFGSLIWR